MSSGEREARLNQLRARLARASAVCCPNARCLTEGVDVPDPRRRRVHRTAPLPGGHRPGRRQSDAQGRRQDGRHHRHPRLRRARTATPRQALDSSEFDRVWQVVKALRAHDDVLADELDELRREQGTRRRRDRAREDRARPPARHRRRLRPRLRHQAGRQTRRRVGSSGSGCSSGTLRARGTRASQRIGARTTAASALGSFTSADSTTWARCDPDRRALLDALPGWTWDALDASWDDGFANLLVFVEREGARARHGGLARGRISGLGTG